MSDQATPPQNPPPAGGSETDEATVGERILADLNDIKTALTEGGTPSDDALAILTEIRDAVKPPDPPPSDKNEPNDNNNNPPPPEQKDHWLNRKLLGG